MKRLEIKVGFFVAVGLALVAILMLQFSKGASFFRTTYTINLKSADAGGLKERAAVLMSGVQVGSVDRIALAPDGRSVTITLDLYKDVRIHKDARFVLEQSGFLGDQYVAVEPTGNQGALFQDGDHAETEAPFNLQQAARSAVGLVKSLDETTKRLNDAIVDIHKLLLNQETLTNMAAMIANLRKVSDEALSAVENLDRLVASNSPAVSQSASNLVLFSEQLNLAGQNINNLVTTNSPHITSAITNLENSAQLLKSMMTDVKAGKGLAGTVLTDQQVAENVATFTRNLSITSSNLNRLGLWGILWKRKPPKEETGKPVEPLRSPKQAAQQGLGMTDH